MKIYIINFTKELVDNTNDHGIHNVMNGSWLNPIFFALSRHPKIEVVFEPEKADIIAQFDRKGWFKIEGVEPPKQFPIEELMSKYGDSKKYLFYIWDHYSWYLRGYNEAGMHTGYLELDVPRLNRTLEKCDWVLCPNEGTARMLSMYSKPKAKPIKILPFTRFFEPENIPDKNYVALCARPYPIDFSDSWAVKALKELEIPYIYNHENIDFFVKKENFKQLLTSCTFIMDTKFEASTNGMSLVEAYNLGKPVLIPNSPFAGGNEMFGERAYTYKWDSYEDLKEKIKFLWEIRPKQNIADCKEFCKRFTPDAMAWRIYEAIEK